MGRTGRPPEEGDERWMTVPEAARALGVTAQAIRNRMLKTETLPYRDYVDESGTTHYRVPRHVIEEEARQKNAPATRKDTAEIDLAMGQRTEEVLQAFAAGVEAIRSEVETQHRQLVPLSERSLANQTKMMGTLQSIENSLNQLFREIRESIARAEEEDRKEQVYQENNLALAREVRDLQKQTLELLSRVEQAEAEREARGLRERRSFWRRMLGSVFG